MNKYFVWHWDEGFEKFSSESAAKARAVKLFDEDYDAACSEGFDEDCFNVCWGVIHEHSVLAPTGKMIDFAGERVEEVNATMEPIEATSHAAELAEALGKSIEQMQYAMQLYKPMGEDYTEIIGVTVKAMTALTNYKESLK